MRWHSSPSVFGGEGRTEQVCRRAPWSSATRKRWSGLGSNLVQASGWLLAQQVGAGVGKVEGALEALP